MPNLKDYVRSIPGFPRQGVIFRDITPILQNPEAFGQAIDSIEGCLKGVDFDVIVAPEARGFIFGAPIARDMGKGFVLIRKKGKLPWKTIEASYDLEYGTATVQMHEDAIKPGQKVVIVDDLLATGGTMKALIDLVERSGGEVVKICCLIELIDLGGVEALAGYSVNSIMTFEGE